MERLGAERCQILGNQAASLLVRNCGWVDPTPMRMAMPTTPRCAVPSEWISVRRPLERRRNQAIRLTLSNDIDGLEDLRSGWPLCLHHCEENEEDGIFQ